MFVCTPHISLLPGVDFRKLLKALRWHSFCSVHGLLHNTGITVINQICGKNPYRSWTILFGNVPGLCALESHSLHVLGKSFYLWNQYEAKNYCRICSLLAKKLVTRWVFTLTGVPPLQELVLGSPRSSQWSHLWGLWIGRYLDLIFIIMILSLFFVLLTT